MIWDSEKAVLVSKIKACKGIGIESAPYWKRYWAIWDLEQAVLNAKGLDGYIKES